MPEKNILTPEEIEEEIRMASLQNKDIDFKRKVLPGFLLQNKKINGNLNLNTAVILSSTSFEGTTIHGDIDLSQFYFDAYFRIEFS